MEERITILRLDDVFPHPQQEAYRPLDQAHVEALAASIAVVGQLDPIRVFQDGEIYVIDSGHHRHAAMKRLGLPEIEAIIIDYDETESVKVMVASNLYRPDTDLERSRGTQLMLALGVRPVDAAALIGERDTDKVEKAGRAMRLVADETACEDLTLDRLVAALDFEDDPEALNKLICAPGDTWGRVYADLLNAKRFAEAVARCEAIIAAAGVTKVEPVYGMAPEGYRYLGRGDEMCEGATGAAISVKEWSSSASVSWYGPAAESDADDTAERDAERERREALAADVKAASDRRLAFLAEYLNSTAPVSLSNALREFAEAQWEDGVDASVSDIREALSGVTGWCPRLYASILSVLDSSANSIFRSPEYNKDYYWSNDGPVVLAYFEALVASGLEPAPFETAILTELRTYLAENVSADEDDSDLDPDEDEEVES